MTPANAPSTSNPSVRAFACAVSTMPSDTSLTTTSSSQPAWRRLREKKPVPQPTSSARPRGRGSPFPALPRAAENRAAAKLMQRSSKEIDHLSS